MFAILYAYKCILLCSLSQIGGSIYLNFTLKKHRIKIISLNSELELKKSNPNNKMKEKIVIVNRSKKNILLKN